MRAAVRASHEWFGGGGYPEKLSGTAIPLASRIIAVADAYDAMTEDRSYRKSLDSGDAVAELLRAAPSQFDPDIVVAFLTVLNRQAEDGRPSGCGTEPSHVRTVGARALLPLPSTNPRPYNHLPFSAVLAHGLR